MIFEMLMGQMPFTERTWDDLARLHLSKAMPRLSIQGAGIPCWLESVVHRAVEKDPSLRYPNAGEFLADLEKLSSDDVGSQTIFERSINYIKPNGTLCTVLNKRGYSRKRIGQILLPIILLIVAAFLIT